MQSENPFVAEYQKAFPHVRLSIFQQELIGASVSNGGAWKEAIIFWAGNNYRAESVFKVIEYYKEISKGQVGQNDYVPQVYKCDLCFDQHTIMAKPKNAAFEWLLESIPCPKCSTEAREAA